MKALRTALIYCILVGMISPVWAGFSSKSSTPSFGSSGRSSSNFTSSGRGWSSPNTGSLGRSGSIPSKALSSPSLPIAPKSFSSSSHGWSTSTTKPLSQAPIPPSRPSGKVEQIITQRSNVTGTSQMSRGNVRDLAVNSPKTHQSLKYPTVFPSEPEIRPKYIPVITSYSGRAYHVIYNPIYGGYGFYVGDSWSPYVYSPPVVVQQTPVVYRDNSPISVIIALWLIAIGLILITVVYIARKIKNGL